MTTTAFGTGAAALPLKLVTYATPEPIGVATVENLIAHDASATASSLGSEKIVSDGWRRAR